MDTPEKWDEFFLVLEDSIYKDPSYLYLYLTETDSNFRQALLDSLSIFLTYSPIQKWQGAFEKDGLTDQYHGLKYSHLESGNKGGNAGGFIPLSQLIAHFIRYLHYTTIYLIKKECSASNLKLFSTLTAVTPYQKMKENLLKDWLIPHITSLMREMIVSEESKMNESVHKSLLLWFSSSAHLLWPIIFQEGESELEGVLAFKEDDTNIVKWLISNLHENKVK